MALEIKTIRRTRTPSPIELMDAERTGEPPWTEGWTYRIVDESGEVVRKTATVWGSEGDARSCGLAEMRFLERLRTI